MSSLITFGTITINGKGGNNMSEMLTGFICTMIGIVTGVIITVINIKFNNRHKDDF